MFKFILLLIGAVCTIVAGYLLYAAIVYSSSTYYMYGFLVACIAVVVLVYEDSLCRKSIN